jgi:hypothetical protein
MKWKIRERIQPWRNLRSNRSMTEATEENHKHITEDRRFSYILTSRKRGATNRRKRWVPPIIKNWNPVNRLTRQECWVSTISDGCKDIRLSKSGKLGRQQHQQAAGCSLRARLLLPLLADPSQVARYLLWRDVAAGASNTPLMSRAATVPPTSQTDTSRLHYIPI